MSTKYGSSLLSCRWVYKKISDGQIIYDQAKTVATSVPLDDYKASVNTGVFIPGIYRVNPYKVYGESCISHFKSWYDVAIDGGQYRSSSTLTGDLGPYFAKYARDIQPAITSNIGNFPQRVIQKAYGKLGDGNVNLGETLGEFRETLKLLRHPFKDLRDFLCDSQFRRLGLLNTLSHYAKTGTWTERGGRALTGKHAAKVAANSWLEFRYGLMPLIYTAQDVIKLVNSAYERSNATRIRSARASIKHSASIGFIKNTVFNAQIAYTEVICDTSGTDDMSFHACVQYRMKGVPTLAHLLQLTPRFWPELAWELTRLSFVVDWFFDVSQWLAALRFTPEIQVLGNTVGVKVDRLVSVKVSSRAANVPGAPLTPRGKLPCYRMRYYDRTTNQSLPIFPLFKPEFHSYLHTVDGLALILQPILGKLR